VEAERANRAKDEFLAILGHELRNPLAPITTALHLLEMRAPNERVRERRVIERQVAHLSRLVDDLLDASRITRGKVELRRETTVFGDAVAAAVEAVGPLLEARRHVLTLDVEPTLLVDADPTRLRQVVANLLTNAAKYTPPAGHIQVHARRSGSNVELVVEDDGVGIAPDLMPRIFESFVQAPQPIARTEGGLGLGLTIARSLVEAHDGTIAVASDGPGKGTRVVVELPLLAVDSRQPTRETEGWNVRRVLVVDDNTEAAMRLRELLLARGHETRTAFDAPSALELAADFRPEVAILDIGLPVMDGYELATRLRELFEDGSIKLIALTGYGTSADEQRAQGAGFHAHVPKPVAFDDLVELLERG
jgi:CheY-like chemotaxis protein